jgi:hypothetical protein
VSGTEDADRESASRDLTRRRGVGAGGRRPPLVITSNAAERGNIPAVDSAPAADVTLMGRCTQ